MMPVCPSGLMVMPACGATTSPKRGSAEKISVAAASVCCIDGSIMRRRMMAGHATGTQDEVVALYAPLVQKLLDG